MSIKWQYDVPFFLSGKALKLKNFITYYSSNINYVNNNANE